MWSRSPTCKAGGRELRRNDSASLLDMGDGVLLLEFHSKANALDDDIFNLASGGPGRAGRRMSGPGW